MDNKADDPIYIETLISAPISDVWSAWTDPAIILNWFGSDPDGWGVSAKLNVHPGGSFEVTFKNSDGSEHTCSGVYETVETCHKLIFSWVWRSEPGVVSFVTVLLYPDDDNTRMHFEHANVGTASAHDYLYGWQATFLKLERLLLQNKS